MRKLISIIVGLAAIGLLALVMLACRAEIESARGIGLVIVGNVDQSLVNRVRDYVSKQYHVAVRIRSCRKIMEFPLEQQTKELAACRSRQDICLLVLAEEPGEITSHGIVFNEIGAGIINVSALKPASSDTPKGAEQYGRRVEKESMRAMGHLIGLETCPNPQCAMSTYMTDAQLDAKGRNLCPPCREKAAEFLSSILTAPAKQKKTTGVSL